MKILIVDSDELSVQKTRAMLLGKKMNVTSVPDWPEASEAMQTYAFDAVLLSMRRDRKAAFDFITGTRLKGIKFPILVLSSDPKSEVRVSALNLGADDFILRPFTTDELVARILAVVRRTHNLMDTTVRIGQLEIDLTSQIARAGGRMIGLTTKEYSVLELLAVRKGRAMSKKHILDQLYGGEDEPNIKVIDVFVCNLRKKLSQALEGRCPVQTVRGRGYLIEAQDDIGMAV
jgi:two-component system, cell cycle response regulator CtrA